MFGIPVPAPNQGNSTPVRPRHQGVMWMAGAPRAAPSLYGSGIPNQNAGFFSPVSRPPPQCPGFCTHCHIKCANTDAGFSSTSPFVSHNDLPLDDDDVTMISVAREIDLTTANLPAIREHVRIPERSVALQYLMLSITSNSTVVDTNRQVLLILKKGGFPKNLAWSLRYPNRDFKTSGTAQQNYDMVCDALDLK